MVGISYEGEIEEIVIYWWLGVKSPVTIFQFIYNDINFL